MIGLILRFIAHISLKLVNQGFYAQTHCELNLNIIIINNNKIEHPLNLAFYSYLYFFRINDQ